MAAFSERLGVAPGYLIEPAGSSKRPLERAINNDPLAEHHALASRVEDLELFIGEERAPQMMALYWTVHQLG